MKSFEVGCQIYQRDTVSRKFHNLKIRMNPFVDQDNPKIYRRQNHILIKIIKLSHNSFHKYDPALQNRHMLKLFAAETMVQDNT